MVNAHDYGIKLLISIHSYNALEGNSDFYGNWYGTGDFYTNNDAIDYFKQRIAHVMAHVNPNNGKTWAQSSEYIFAFEAQNEAMHPQVQAPSPSSTYTRSQADLITGKPLGPRKLAVHHGPGHQGQLSRQR
jgi:mannan endo-1,4-beta-mannosidase